MNLRRDHYRVEGPYGSDPGGPLAHHTLLKPPPSCKGRLLRPTAGWEGVRAPRARPAAGPRPAAGAPNQKLSIRESGRRKPPNTTCNDGSLGSGIDEERSEMRDVMRIADQRESLNL